MTPQTPILNWRGPDGQQTVDESALSIAGLVRSEVEFAGSAVERSGRQSNRSLAGPAAIGQPARHRPRPAAVPGR